MQMLSGLALYSFQEPVHAVGAQINLLTIFVGIIALFFFLLMVGVAVGAIYAMKMVKEVKVKIESLEKRGEALIAQVTATAAPFVTKAHDLIDDLSPKIKSVSSDVEAVSKTVRAKVEEIGVTVSQVNGTVQDTNGKTRVQIARVDGIVTGALQTTHEVSQKIQHGIRVPINHLAGMVAGLKTGLETLVAKSPWGNKPSSPYDL